MLPRLTTVVTANSRKVPSRDSSQALTHLEKAGSSDTDGSEDTGSRVSPSSGRRSQRRDRGARGLGWRDECAGVSTGAGSGGRPVPARYRGRGTWDTGAGTVTTASARAVAASAGAVAASAGAVAASACAVAASAVSRGWLAGGESWGADVRGEGEVAIVVARAAVDYAVLLAGGVAAVFVRLPAQSRGVPDGGLAGEVLRKEC